MKTSTIKSFSEAHLSDFARLYHAVYRKNIAPSFIRAKFTRPDLGDRFFGFIAYDGTVPVSFFGAVPVLIGHGTQTERAAQAVDAMTHPQYRGRGLLAELARLTHEVLEKNGFTMIFGFPNQNSEHLLLDTLHWQFSQRMSGYYFRTGSGLFSRIINEIPILKNALRRKSAAQLLQYVTTALMPTGNDRSAVTTVRDAVHFDYKRFSGNFVIQAGGCIFWIKNGKKLVVGDFEADTSAAFQRGLSALKTICKKGGVSEIHFQVTAGSRKDLLLKSFPGAMQFDSWIIGYKNFNSSFPLEKLEFTLADVDIF
ncbi:hypothetical protein HYN48_05045 [Flavobacterium magnum]|uniref:N-acetyltransferase domain-containing protein n=1 Tax=Flavobacterium magnum TaxID=2162713 RepID=A0A2S0RCY9_9FLAO|nr:GNAT family N-acetyltransferase [Flavobacterium magnum]AWA29504.1 hypothetical protein HYN48_05045 [Flavobacterium magnum]